MRLGTNVPAEGEELNKTKVISEGGRGGNQSPNPTIVAAK